MFLLFGVGLFIGNQLGGKLADRNGRTALIATVASLTAMLFAMTLLIHNPITAAIGVLLYGIAAFPFALISVGSWAVTYPVSLLSRFGCRAGFTLVQA